MTLHWTCLLLVLFLTVHSLSSPVPDNSTWNSDVIEYVVPRSPTLLRIRLAFDCKMQWHATYFLEKWADMAAIAVLDHGYDRPAALDDADPEQVINTRTNPQFGFRLRSSPGGGKTLTWGRMKDALAGMISVLKQGHDKWFLDIRVHDRSTGREVAAGLLLPVHPQRDGTSFSWEGLSRNETTWTVYGTA